MRTVVEFWALARDSAVLWLRCWVPLVGWFSLGYGINALAGHVSTLLVGQKILDTTIIVNHARTGRALPVVRLLVVRRLGCRLGRWLGRSRAGLGIRRRTAV